MFKRTLLSAILGLLLTLGTITLAGQGRTNPADLLRDAEEALKDRNFKKAVQILEQATATAGDNHDYLLYLSITAHQLEGAHDRAVELCDRLVKDHPGSPWIIRTMFKKAECLTALKQPEQALPAYEDGLARIMDPARRKRIAMMFVEAARKILYPSGDPKTIQSSPAALRSAHQLLSKALELQALGADEESVRWDMILCLSRGEFDPNLLTDETRLYVEKFPKSPNAAEATFLRGQAMIKQGRWWEAKQTWEGLLRDYPNSPLGARALYELARFHGLHNRNSDLEEIHRGIGYLNRLEQRYPNHELTRNGLWEKAMTYASLPQLQEDALQDLEKFVQKYPQDERVPEALLRIGDLYLVLQKEQKAMETWEDLVKRYPESGRWQEARARISESRFQKGLKPYLKGDFEAARKAFAEFSSQAPADSRMPLIGFLLGDMLHREKKYREAVEQWSRTAAAGPNSSEASRARFMSAETLGRDMEDFEQALKEYEQAQTAPWNHLAKQRMAELQSKQLWAESDRLFTTQDVPYLTLSTRNVEKIRLRVNSLTLQDVLAQKGSFRDLQKIPVSIIAPDKEWEVSVKDYKPYKRFAFPVEIPFRTPGAYIVSARAGDMEATVVCLVTDLAFIAKIGNRGIRIMAQNLLTGDEIASEMLALKTAVQGRVLNDPYMIPAGTTTLEGSLLAEFQGGSAFQNFAMPPLASAEPQPAATLITDRNLYKAGETVFLKAVAHGPSRAEEKPARLRWTAPNGKTFSEQAVPWSETGTAQTRVTLPLAGSVGDWTITLLEDSRTLAQRKFTVFAPQPNSYRTVFDMAEKTMFVGDELEVHVFVSDFTGRPFAGRKLVYTVTGWTESREIMTSEGGTATIRITDTEQFYRTPRIALTVRMPDSSGGAVLGRHPIVLTRKGYEIVFTRPEVFLNALFPDEDRPVPFQTRQFDGTPAGQQEIRWELFRFNEAYEKIVEQSGPLKTDAAGQASLTFRCKSPGPYVLMLTGRDSRGLPVVAWKEIVVEPDSRQTSKLFLRTDREEYRTGEEIALEAVSLLDRCQGFLTVEQEDVRHVQRVTLEKGRNTLKLNLKDRDLRRFTVALSVLQGREFHVAERTLKMMPPLIVETVPDKKDYVPGEEVRLQIRLKDALGRPQRGEILVLVNDAFDTEDSPAAPAAAEEKPMVTAASIVHRFVDGRFQAVMELQEAISSQVRQEQQKYMPPRPLLPAREDRRGSPDPVQTLQANPQTLLWNPGIVVNEQGAAEVRFTLPRQNGRWRIRTCAVSADRSYSETHTDIRASHDLTFELAAPQALVAGDSATASAFIRNSSTSEKKGEVEWTVHLNDLDTVQKSAFTVPPKSTIEVSLPWTSEITGNGWISASVGGTIHKQFLTVRPKHPVHTASRSGWARNDTVTLTLEAAPQAAPDRVKLFVSLSPSTFLTALRDHGAPDGAGPAMTEAARLRSFLALATEARPNPAVQESISRLLLAQQFRGEWTRFTEGEDPYDPLATAFVYETLLRARNAGYTVDAAAIAKTSEYLKGRLSSADQDEIRIFLLHALSLGGDAPQALLLRLQRDRDSLSTRALAMLVQIFVNTGKPEEAAAAAALIEKRVETDAASARWTLSHGKNVAWLDSPAAVTALAAAALQKISPKHPLAEKSIHWLVTHREPKDSTDLQTGLWGPPAERAVVMELLAASPTLRAASEDMTLRVEINGREWAVLNSKTARPMEFLTLPHRSGTAKITLTPGGSGSFLYHAVMEFETAKTPEHPLRAQAEITYHHPPLVLDGELIEPPTRTLPKKQGAESQPKSVPAGAPFDVTARILLQGDAPYRAEVSIPIPAGCRLLKTSREVPVVTHPDRLVLFLDKPTAKEAAHDVTFRLAAAHPGTYRLRPVTVTRADLPEELRIPQFSETVIVREPGKGIQEIPNLSPDEQYTLGKYAYSKKDFDQARLCLAPLLSQPGLTESYVTDAARMLLEINIRDKKHEEIIRAFDLLRERAPAEVIPFDRARILIQSFHAVRDYGRHRRMVLAMADSLFLQEVRMLGIMEEAGQLGHAGRNLRRLTMDFPETPLVRDTLYGVILKLRKLSESAGAAGSSGNGLQETAEECNRFMTLLPDDPRGDEISLCLVTLHLTARDYAAAESAARAAAARHPKSRYLENFDASFAYALFAQKKFDDALTMYDRLMTHDYGKEANPPPDQRREIATLMKATIYHAQGDMTRALEHYQKVKEIYADAREAIKYLERTALSLPEVTRVSPDQPSRLDLDYSGIDSVAVKVYKVDLLNLFLESKGMPMARTIDLPVRPTFEKTYTLPNASSRKKEKYTLDLGMKEAGAYLVNVRSRNFTASGFLIRSDLSLEVQEDPQAGKVRVNVLHARTGKFEENVRVTTMGSGDDKAVTTRTDLRGIAETPPGLKGFVTVIAEKDGHTAVYQGTASLSGYTPPVQPPPPSGKATPHPAVMNAQKLKELQDEAMKKYGQNFQKSVPGVDIQLPK